MPNGLGRLRLTGSHILLEGVDRSNVRMVEIGDVPLESLWVGTGTFGSRYSRLLPMSADSVDPALP